MARLERASTPSGEAQSEATIPPQRDFRSPPRASANAGTLQAGIVYSRTRVFQPSAELLEKNRIMNPASADPGAAAFRMLRTQVLQRMDTHGWRSLAIFSPVGARRQDDDRHQPGTEPCQRPASHRTAGRFRLQEADSRGQARHHARGRRRRRAERQCTHRGLPVPSGRVRSPGRDAGPRHSPAFLRNPGGPEEPRARCGAAGALPGALHRVRPSAGAERGRCARVRCRSWTVAWSSRRREDARNDLVRTVELLRKIPLVGTVLNRAAGPASTY